MPQAVRPLGDIKEISPTECLAIRVVTYVNVTFQAKRKKISIETSLDPLDSVFVFKRVSSNWEKIKCKILRKQGPDGEFQKNVLSWMASFSPTEQQTFRIVLVKNQPLISCLLHPGKCIRNPMLIPNSVFICYPSALRYFRKSDFKRAINSTLGLNGMTPAYWDEQTERGHFDCKVCLGIQNSIFVVLELSDCNSNVIFEFGFSIGIGKDYFLLKKDRSKKMPSDIDQFDQIRYSSFAEMRSKLTDRIQKRYLTG